MSKFIVVVQGTDPEASAPMSRGRLTHALNTAKDLSEAGNDVKIFFEGAGVIWLKRFDLRDDKFTQHYGETFDAVKSLIHGACAFCTSGRFKVGEHAEKLGVTLFGGDGHGTIAALLSDGYQPIIY